MASSGLAETQRLLWRLITAPEGVALGLRDAGDPDGRDLAAVIRGDARLDATARLDVYANAYFYRIRDALREDFGALHAALGEVAFHNLVTAYLIAHPPAHPSLRQAGRHLAPFLAHTADGTPYRERAPFAPDLAALEWALLEAFDAPDAPVLSREALAAVPPDAWGGLRFSPAPSLQVLTVSRPVQLLREAFDRGEAMAGAATACLDAREAGPTVLRVWRRRERVFYRPMPPREQRALALLREGAPFGDLCAAIASETGEAAAPAETLALLEGWLSDALLENVRTGLDVPPGS